MPERHDSLEAAASLAEDLELEGGRAACPYCGYPGGAVVSPSDPERAKCPECGESSDWEDWS